MKCWLAYRLSIR